MIVLLFLSIWSLDIDDQGIAYQDDRTILQKATRENTISITIPASVQNILGSTNEKDQPFYICKNNLKEINFSPNSQLSDLGIYCFKSLLIENIDMTYCTLLKYLSSGCFHSCKKLKSLILPPNIEEIRDGSCAYVAIQKIKLPNSLLQIKTLGTYGMAFEYVSSLKEVEYDDAPSLEYIGGNAFGGCGLTTFRIPAKCSYIGNAAFSNCPIIRFTVDEGNLHFSSDGESVMSVDGKTLIMYAGGLTGSYVVPEYVTVISTSAFSSTHVTKLTLSSNLKTIQSFAFYNTKFTKLDFPSSCESLSNKMFEKSQIENVTFGRVYTKLPSAMFLNCQNLKSFYLPSGLVEIPASFFEGCTNLTYIFVPKSVTSIGTKAFALLPKDVEIEFEEGSTINYANGTIFNSDFTKIISYFGSSTSYTVIKSVKNIGDSAFHSFQIDVEFEKGSNLEEIGEYSFAYNTAITSIEFPSKLKYIRNRAFVDCSNLETVIFDNSLQTVESAAFARTSIVNLTLPPSLLKIGDSAFKECKKIITFSFGANTLLKEIGSGAFQGSSITKVTIPKYCASIGSNAFMSSSLRTLTFPDDVEFSEIPNSAFSGCQELVTIIFGGIRSVASYAFEDCTSIVELRLGSVLENISTYAFRGCTGMERISIWGESALKLIEGLAFDGCIKLLEFDLQDSTSFVTSEEKDILFDFSKRQIVVYLPASPRTFLAIEETVEEIGPYAFQGASNLVEIAIPEGKLRSIGFCAFSGCTSLKTINIPLSVSDIANLAFEGCTALGCDSITFGEDIRDRLVQIGTPAIALEHCPTQMFTAGTTAHEQIFLMFPLLDSGSE